MRILLDHNATTPLREEVLDSMLRVLRDVPGNPSSVHAEGAEARRVVEEARERVAELLGAAPGQVIFTGSATEANNTVLRGVAASAGPGAHVVTSAVEHPSVAEPCAALEAEGVRVTRVPVDGEGRLDLDAFAAALAEGACLASVILAHNETGVLQDAARLRDATAAHGVPLHLDATQAVGKIALDAGALGADWLSASAHKLSGPKGVGLLLARGPQPLAPLLRGGPQERRRRGGTENTAGVAGFGVACALARAELPERTAALAALRDRLWARIRAEVPEAVRLGAASHVLPNTLCVGFRGASAEILLEALDLEGVAVSAGAACASGALEPSGTLAAMGVPQALAEGALRFSVGHGVDAGQIDRVAALLPGLVARVREGGESAA